MNKIDKILTTKVWDVIMSENGSKFDAEMEAAAKEFLSENPEWKSQSEERAKHHEQKHNPFHDFMDSYDLFPDTPERRQPTPAEKERLDRYLSDLGQLFEGSDINWHIDGALNISLMKGSYIGAHKDIDISVDEDDLEKLDALLRDRGFGMFLSQQPEADGVNIMTRADAQQIRKNYVQYVAIARINEVGKITRGRNLNYLDVHLMRKNKQGQRVTAEGAAFPKSWQQPRVIEYNGASLKVSHPTEVAYHKLRQNWPETRGYDQADLRMLAEYGKLSESDIYEIENLLELERQARYEHASAIAQELERNFGKYPELSQAEIDIVINNYPLLRQRWGDPVLAEVVDDLSKKIYESRNKSVATMSKLIFDAFTPVNFYSNLKEKAEQLRIWIRGK